MGTTDHITPLRLDFSTYSSPSCSHFSARLSVSSPSTRHNNKDNKDNNKDNKNNNNNNNNDNSPLEFP